MLYLLLGGYLLLLLLFDLGGLDLRFAKKLFQLQGGYWALQYHWLTEQLLHQAARKFNYIVATSVLLTTLYYVFFNKEKPYRTKAYLALCLALISSFALVAYFKALTNVACPWDLQLFGGKEPYFHLLSLRPNYLPYHQCFPAGHASVGYAWVALYSFFKHTRPDWRFVGLTTGLLAGLVLGFTQQLRGAHFMSHDLTTLLICLLCTKGCFALFFPKNQHQQNN